MSKQEIKKTGNRLWDLVQTIASAVGGAFLTFAGSTPEILSTNVTYGQVVGAVLLSTVTFRVATLIFNEQ